MEKIEYHLLPPVTKGVAVLANLTRYSLVACAGFSLAELALMPLRFPLAGIVSGLISSTLLPWCIALLAVLAAWCQPVLMAKQGIWLSRWLLRLGALFAPLIPVMYLDTAADAVLKGLDEQVYCMKINILDAAFSLLMVFFFVPRMGAAGYVLTVFLSECFNTLLSILRLCRRIDLSLPLLSSLILPALSALASAGLAKTVLALETGLPQKLSLLLGLAVFLALYTLLLRLTGAFKKEDRRYFRRLLPPVTK